jgi:MFS transporter, DHA1 family, multidrug resistance protein
MGKAKTQGSKAEFICLMAVLMSLVALTIDTVLPALGQIGDSLGVQDPNNNQLIIFTLFFGLSLGQMLYGPVSDSFGRKKAIYLGISIFILGSVMSLLATSFHFMLVGRVCQGFGVASCRVVTLAMIRDKLEGREMGRVMSLIMVLFIMVPAIAPSMGQAILFFAGWRAIFGMILLIGIFGSLWFLFRQPETLAIERRLPFSIATILAGVIETAKNPVTRCYMAAAGIIFGAFVGYLSSAQQILQIQYQLGDAFSLYFGGLAVAIGASSFVTSKLVMRLGMEKLSLIALLMLAIISFLFYLYCRTVSGQPNLYVLLVYLTITFFSFGMLFGTLNTLAVQPMGHIAGVATSVIASVQTLLSVVVGGVIGQCYDGTVMPLILGFALCGLSSLAIILYIRKCVADVSAPCGPVPAKEPDGERSRSGRDQLHQAFADDELDSGKKQEGIDHPIEP